jgi:hypothetical protein
LIGAFFADVQMVIVKLPLQIPVFDIERLATGYPQATLMEVTGSNKPLFDDVEPAHRNNNYQVDDGTMPTDLSRRGRISERV